MAGASVPAHARQGARSSLLGLPESRTTLIALDTKPAQVGVASGAMKTPMRALYTLSGPIIATAGWFCGSLSIRFNVPACASSTVSSRTMSLPNPAGGCSNCR